MKVSISGLQNISRDVTSMISPLNIEKRHDFYDNEFNIAIHDNKNLYESDNSAILEFLDILKTLFNAKYA